MNRALVIGADQRREIAALIAKAAARPTPLADVERAAAFRARSGVASNALNEASTIELPHGYAVTYTHEEQPGGVCRHMSIGVDRRGVGPHPAAVAMLMEEFGFVSSFGAAPMWLDELGDGHLAINVLEPLDGDLGRLKKPA